MTITVQRPSAVGDVLAARAAASPDVRALVVGDDAVSYAELWDRAAHTARGLQRLGVGPGDLVGVLMPNCVDFVVLFHAVGLVGATVVPINIRYRRSELRYLVAHSRMKVLVTSDLISDHVDLLDLVADSFGDLRSAAATEALRVANAPDLRHVVLCGGRPDRGGIGALSIEDVRAVADDDPRDPASFTAAAGPDDVLMVLYTSGTTAAPKGCQIPQRAVTENWTHWVEAIHLAEGDRIWLACPFFHIAGIGPAIGATIAGATALTDTHFDADAALALIEREEPVHLFPAFPPITFGVLRHPAYDRRRFGFIRTLHNVAPPDTMRVVQQLLPDAAVVLNNFGMTESAGCVTYAGPDATEEVRIGTTGPALTGFDVRVADPETCAALPTGERGEIQFRGPNTFRAYLHDPVATAATILDGGWIRTGDLGVMDEGDNLVYIGRIKEMLKVGGENVAPTEVEAHLSTHPAVQLVQVVGRQDERYGEVPVAFVELAPGQSATADELIAFCRGQLASFKVPREVRFVTEWPMSATKIQKRVLREQLDAER